MNEKNYPPLMTVNQTAELLQCSPRTVTQFCVEGRIKAHKMGRHWRVNRDALFADYGLESGARDE